MHVLLIYPDILRTNYSGSYYHGIGYLSAALKMAGHSVSLIHLVGKTPSKPELVKQVMEAKPGLVAFSATTNQFLYVKIWLKWLKEADPSLLTVCGGIHTTLNPEEAIATDGLDIICRGEGEEALVELANCLDRHESIDNIKNLWIKKGVGSILRNSLRPIIRDLDTLPFADKEIFDFPRLYHSRKAAVFMASRGCPYSCSYCCNHALRQLYPTAGGHYVRFRSVDHVIEEIREVLTRFSFIKHIKFDDDTLSLRREWFREFSNKYAAQIGVPFICNVRPDLVDEEMVQLLKVAGCCGVYMGIESGSERIRNNVLNRGLTRREILRAFELCKKDNLKSYSYNMVGLPFESWNDIFDTIELNADCEVDAVQATVFYPYRNTALYNIADQNGLLTDKEVPDYLWESILKLKNLTHAEITFANQFFPYLVWVFKVSGKGPIRFRRGLRSLLRCVLHTKVVQGVLLRVHAALRPIVRCLRCSVIGQGGMN